MQSNKQPAFTWSDAWLLLAIAMACGETGASLSAVIAAGDFIDHAIFTGPEVRRGIAKLVHVGHIKVVEGRFQLADKAAEFWTSQKSSRKQVSALRAAFEGFLNAAPYPAGDPRVEDPDWSYSSLTDQVIAQAYEEYVQRVERTVRRKKNRSAKRA